MSSRSSLRAVAQGLPGVATFLALWEVVPRLGIFNPEYLPPFSRVVVALWAILIDGTLLTHVTISLERSLGGFGLATAVAVPAGLLLGWYPKVEEFFDPLLQLFRQTSVLALFPVFILVFGLGEFSKIFNILGSAVADSAQHNSRCTGSGPPPHQNGTIHRPVALAASHQSRVSGSVSRHLHRYPSGGNLFDLGACGG